MRRLVGHPIGCTDHFDGDYLTENLTKAYHCANFSSAILSERPVIPLEDIGHSVDLLVQVDTPPSASEVVLAQGIKEVRVNQGELWTMSFHNLCSSTGIKVMSWDQMSRKQEELQSYEEGCRNHRSRQSEGLQQSSLRSVVEGLYNRFHPNQYEQELTAKPTGICGIMIVQQILWRMLIAQILQQDRCQRH
ncbi:hypothetical protein NDA12_004176 [Ustilago hordei]|nr:hypothetical protein NDA15_001523 [Ustilago hordei]KAJ1571814.1 hypothetical protein NDA12_004176 [Ustilago hordei]